MSEPEEVEIFVPCICARYAGKHTHVGEGTAISWEHRPGQKKPEDVSLESANLRANCPENKLPRPSRYFRSLVVFVAKRVLAFYDE